MRNALYTIDHAKTQARVFGDALDAAVANGATGKVLQGFAIDYWNACAFATNVELDHLRAEPPSCGDAALDDNLWHEYWLDKTHLEKLNAAGPSHYTIREHIDASFAAILSKEKWGIVFDRIDAKPRRGKRKALVHGDKIKTGQYVCIDGERVPVLRKMKP